MKYSDMSVSSAVLSYLESYAPARPRDIVAMTEKSANQVYTALYQLKKVGKVKNLKGKGWTVVHRTPKVKTQPELEQNTVRQYEDLSAVKAKRELEIAREKYDDLLEKAADKQKAYDDLFAVAKYLEKRNGQLLARIWEMEFRTNHQGE